jgi:hypothetical protein
MQFGDLHGGTDLISGVRVGHGLHGNRGRAAYHQVTDAHSVGGVTDNRVRVHALISSRQSCAHDSPRTQGILAVPVSISSIGTQIFLKDPPKAVDAACIARFDGSSSFEAGSESPTQQESGQGQLGLRNR